MMAIQPKEYEELKEYWDFQRKKEYNKVKVFEMFKSGVSPLSEEMETIIQDWLTENDQIEIVSTSQSQHLRENTVFVTVFYRPSN